MTVAVAGVMGGANSEINEETKSILYESANFNSVSVRLTAKSLGMRTEASNRMEKGLDIENTVAAADRMAQLVEMTGAGSVCDGLSLPRFHVTPRAVEFNPERINKLLGTAITVDEMVDILEILGINVDKSRMCICAVIQKRYSQGTDLAEEIARFHDIIRSGQPFLREKLPR